MTASYTPTRITIEELEERLPELLAKVQHERETFVVERDGVAIAQLSPPTPPGITAQELLNRVGNLRMPEGLADDLEAIHRAQADVKMPEWPD